MKNIYKKFYIETYGCQMNKADSDDLVAILTKNNFQPAEDPKQSDIVIINTCSVRQTAENRIWGRIGFFKNLKSKKDVILLITGCMAQRLGKEFFSLNPVVDIVVGTFYKNQIPQILKDFRHGEKLAFTEEKEFTFYDSVPLVNNPRKAFVTISHGCNNFCSYCIVPYVRGREISRKSSDIIKDIQNLSNHGVKQITLLGQNVNSYGNDTNDLSFPMLLKKICSETDVPFIKFISSHPKDFTEELIAVISSEDRISNWLHLAIQSGSNTILSKMNRHYTAEDFEEKIIAFKNKVPNANITTDIIVGFPGESDEDYNATVNLMKRIRFDDAYMYKYNIREGTIAAKKYDDSVNSDVKTRRLTDIINLQHKITQENRQKRIGSTTEVIVESKSKKNQNEVLGLTKNDLMIIFDPKSDDYNKIFKVKITKLKKTTLFGELI